MEDDKKEKPVLDEQQSEENVMKLQLAIHDGLTVEVQHYKERDFHIARGKLKSIVAGDCIIFDDGERIKFSEVINVFVD
ncbi:YolD-like family protein [Virgibacillus oceani]